MAYTVLRLERHVRTVKHNAICSVIWRVCLMTCFSRSCQVFLMVVMFFLNIKELYGELVNFIVAKHLWFLLNIYA